LPTLYPQSWKASFVVDATEQACIDKVVDWMAGQMALAPTVWLGDSFAWVKSSAYDMAFKTQLIKGLYKNTTTYHDKRTQTLSAGFRASVDTKTHRPEFTIVQGTGNAVPLPTETDPSALVPEGSCNDYTCSILGLLIKSGSWSLVTRLQEVTIPMPIEAHTKAVVSAPASTTFSMLPAPASIPKYAPLPAGAQFPVYLSTTLGGTSNTIGNTVVYSV
jgi:hypothetical protein